MEVGSDITIDATTQPAVICSKLAIVEQGVKYVSIVNFEQANASWTAIMRVNSKLISRDF